MVMTTKVMNSYKEEYLKEESSKYVISNDAIIESLEFSVEELHEDLIYFLKSQGLEEDDMIMTHSVCLEGESKCLGLIEQDEKVICLTVINLENGSVEIYS